MTKQEKEEIKKLFVEAEQHFEKGEYSEAIEYYDKVLKIEPKDINTLFNKGNTLLLQEKFQEAIQCYDKVLEIEPNNIGALNNEGNALFKQKKYQEAIQCYDKLLEIEPKDIDTLFNKGNALARQEKYQEAIQCYDKVLDIEPNNIGALFNKGNALADQKKYQKAIQCYDKLLEIEPNNINALNNKGVALVSQENYQEAIQCYDKVLKIEPKDIDTLFNKGNALLLQENYQEAIQCYDKLLEIEPKDIDTLFFKGIALLYISSDIDTTECAECFTKSGSTLLLILNKFSEDTKVNRKTLDAVVNRMIEDDPFFKSATEDKDPIAQYKTIYLQTLQIVSLLFITDKDIEQKVAHYTRRAVSYDLLLEKEENGVKKEKSPLRLNSIAKGNDPKEGKTLFDYLDIDRDCDTNNDDYQAFIACFTFNKQSLNQFRLYGKEEQREATGVSLVVNNSYFNNQIGFKGSLFNSKTLGSDLPKTASEDKKLSLFRCIYIDPETHQVISIGHKEDYEIYRDAIDIKETDTPEDIEKKGEAIRKEIKIYNDTINAQLEKVRTQLSSLNKYIKDNDKKEKLDMQVVKELLIMLRYLVKHVAFKEEQECRILRVEKIDSEEVTVEDNSRMFINYNTIDKAVKTIYTGPMFEDVKLYRDVIRRQCKDINVCPCQHPFFSK